MNKSGLTDSRTNQHITLKDGRLLAYAEFGDPDGIPVIYNHGFGGARLEWLIWAREIDTAELGVRLIAPDRPGMGNSTFQRGRRLLAWPDDITALADALEIETFATLGVSGGGPYTAACAYKIPERLSSIGIVVGMGPSHAPGATEGVSWTLPKMNGLVRAVMLFFMSRGIQKQPERFVEQGLATFSTPDQAFLSQPENQSAFVLATQASYAQGGRGNAHEAGIYRRPWGFDISQIQSRIHLWYGEQDKVVRASVGGFWAEQLPDNQAVVWSDEGHFSWASKYIGDVLNTLIA